MFSARLYLSFPVDPLYADKLKAANPALLSEFVDGGEKGLCEFSHRGIDFLGKKLPSLVSFDRLELIEKNIYSLLKRLVADFPYQETPLYLIALLDDNS